MELVYRITKGGQLQLVGMEDGFSIYHFTEGSFLYTPYGLIEALHGGLFRAAGELVEWLDQQIKSGKVSSVEPCEAQDSSSSDNGETDAGAMDGTSSPAGEEAGGESDDSAAGEPPAAPRSRKGSGK
ncbi:hypothetical protein [Endothiovibrio diazotrophicus]